MEREQLKFTSTKAAMMNNDMRVLGLALGLVWPWCAFTLMQVHWNNALPSSLSRGPAFSSRIMQSHILHSLLPHGFWVKSMGTTLAFLDPELPPINNVWCIMKLRLWRNYHCGIRQNSTFKTPTTVSFLHTYWVLFVRLNIKYKASAFAHCILLVFPF